MAKQYVVSFGTSNFTGLSPTFLVFSNIAGTSISPRPSISEIGPATGLYSFTYGPTNAIGFVISANSASVPFVSRYVSGSLDPVQAVDEQLTGVGNTMQAIGSSGLAQGVTISSQITAQGVSLIAQGATILASIGQGGSSFLAFGATILSWIGTTASSYGDTAIDPSTLFGFLRRQQEFNEGNSIFNKTTGAWDVYARGGFTTMLFEKIVTDASGSVTKV